jgi:hypothetical protein
MRFAPVSPRRCSIGPCWMADPAALYGCAGQAPAGPLSANARCVSSMLRGADRQQALHLLPKPFYRAKLGLYGKRASGTNPNSTYENFYLDEQPEACYHNLWLVGVQGQWAASNLREVNMGNSLTAGGFERIEFDGGTFFRANKKQFPSLKGLAVQMLKLKPGAVREPHSHPNAEQLERFPAELNRGIPN